MGDTIGQLDLIKHSGSAKDFWKNAVVAPVADALLGLSICYDLRFPELFRMGVLQGAQLIALGANWPDARHTHWRALLIARAIENQAFVLGVNRTGTDPHLSYAGGTIAIDPRGTILGELGHGEGVLSIDIDPKVVTDWRATFPALRDIRLISSDNPTQQPGSEDPG